MAWTHTLATVPAWPMRAALRTKCDHSDTAPALAPAPQLCTHTCTGHAGGRRHYTIRRPYWYT